MDAVRIQSKFLVVAPNRVLHPAQLVVRHGRVVELTANISQTADVDLGETVLIPGLVNAHSHLEFSSLGHPFPVGKSFPDWIAQVVRYRRELAEQSEAKATVLCSENLSAAIRTGLNESFLTGTAVVGDIVTLPWQTSCLPKAGDFQVLAQATQADWQYKQRPLSPVAWQEHFAPLSYPRVVAFAELLGLQPERVKASWQWACDVTEHSGSELLMSAGLSPHAPYSIHFPTIERLLASDTRSTTVAMHLAESPAELEWLNSGTGPFHEMLQRLGISVQSPPPSIEQCIELLSRHTRSLLVHGNYLTQTQCEQAASVPSLSVVYCPRTHTHFGHEPYPLLAMLEAGLPVILATDSRASSPSLCLWDELAEVRRLFPQLAAVDLLSRVTLLAARALGVERDFGTLDIGKFACASTIRAQPNWTADNLLEEMSRRSTAELGFVPLSWLLLS